MRRRGQNAARMRNNADWLRDLTLMDFLRDAGRYLTLGWMLQKESVKSRMETGISYTEFSYMVLQAYDFWHLFRTERCELQIGGSDQWGNITAGHRADRQARGAADLRHGVSSDHHSIRHQIREERGRKHLAGSRENQPLSVLPVLDQYRRQRCRAVSQAVHLPATG